LELQRRRAPFSLPEGNREWGVIKKKKDRHLGGDGECLRRPGEAHFQERGKSRGIIRGRKVLMGGGIHLTKGKRKSLRSSGGESW